MKQVTVILLLSVAAFLDAAPTTVAGETDIISEILRVTKDQKEFADVAEYLEKSRTELLKDLPNVDSDGKPLSYTFFAPTSTAIFLELPQDAADPLLLDGEFRRTVLLRHFSRQRVQTVDDFSKSNQLIMADTTLANLTICPHHLTTEDTQCINDVTIQTDKAIQLGNNLGTIYPVDGVFMSGDEVSQVLSKHPSKPFFHPLIPGFRALSEDKVPTEELIDYEDVAVDGGLNIRDTPLGHPILGAYLPALTNETDVQEIADFATKYISSNQTTTTNASPLTLVKVTKAEKQVVAGLNYRLELHLRNSSSVSQTCQVVVFDQPWTSTREVTSFSCSSSI